MRLHDFLTKINTQIERFGYEVRSTHYTDGVNHKDIYSIYKNVIKTVVKVNGYTSITYLSEDYDSQCMSRKTLLKRLSKYTGVIIK